MVSHAGKVVLALILILVAPGMAFAGEAAVETTSAFSTTTTVLLVVYCGLIALSSLFGGFLPMLVQLTHKWMQVLVSLVGGLMLGVGIFHQLPHAVVIMPQTAGGSGALDSCMWWLMFGLLLTFFMLRMFHFHNHGPMAEDDEHTHDCSHHHDHDSHHSHDHDHGHGHSHDEIGVKNASWIGIFLGLSLHTLLDGVALAAAVEADALHHGSNGFALLGIGTFLGVVLHKPLDSLSITSLMAAGGWSRVTMQLANFGYALMCPIGAGLFCIGISSVSGGRDAVVAAALAMSAGVFICISLSDLLPEVQFHSHDRLWLSLALILGVGLAGAIGLIEPAHTHGSAETPAVHNHDGHQHNSHNHAGHDHR